MSPISEPAWISGSDAKNRIIGDWHQQIDAEDKRQTDAQQAAIKEIPAASANERWPDENPGQEKHQRHQRDVLQRGVNIESKPALAVENWRRQPMIGRIVERFGRGRLRSQIG